MISKTTIRTNIKVAINCWLRYALSQPIDIDLYVALYFLQRYLGIPSLLTSVARIKEELVSTTASLARRNVGEEAVAYQVK